MNHGSVFSGIGGFDLAAEWMGWHNIFHCEWNEFGQKILKYYWPNAKSYTDIKKTDFTIHRGATDILTGGFPCQPYSVAGKRMGKEDDRHLWPEMLRAVRQIRPRWIVGENVLGLLNWSNGLVFDQVQTEMEAAFENSETCRSLKREGYQVFPYVLPACAVNAPHRRDRVWFVAYSGHDTARQAGGRSGHEGRESSAIYPSGQRRDSTAILPIGLRTIPGITSDTESAHASGAGWGDNRREQDSPGIGGGLFNEPGSYGTERVTPDTCGTGRENGFWNGGRKDETETGAGMEFRYERSGENGIVADTQRFGGRQRESEIQSKQPTGHGVDGIGEQRHDPYPGESGREGHEQPGFNAEENRRGRTGIPGTASELYRCPNWDHWPTQSPLCDGNDGFSSRLDGITFPKWRNESIKAGGNAIVPQVAFQIFKAIDQYEKNLKNNL